MVVQGGEVVAADHGSTRDALEPQTQFDIFESIEVVGMEPPGLVEVIAAHQQNGGGGRGDALRTVGRFPVEMLEARLVRPIGLLPQLEAHAQVLYLVTRDVGGFGPGQFQAHGAWFNSSRLSSDEA